MPQLRANAKQDLDKLRCLLKEAAKLNEEARTAVRGNWNPQRAREALSDQVLVIAKINQHINDYIIPHMYRREGEPAPDVRELARQLEQLQEQIADLQNNAQQRPLLRRISNE